MTLPTLLDIQAIFACLPHRYPLLLVDKILELAPDASITALKNVTVNEPFFQGHFPDSPIMPGLLIVESMAQTTAILSFYSQKVSKAEKDRFLYLLASVEKVKFHTPVKPGDQLFLQARLQWTRQQFSKFEVNAYVNESVVCSAEIVGMQKAY